MTFTPESNREKDLLLERFLAWATVLSRRVKEISAKDGVSST
jgi:hypothetical protein